MRVESGARLGWYEIVAPLGKGGMGEVWRARDTRLDREVALKFLPPGFVDDLERHARFEREAKLLASLNHPNIAVLYGLEVLEGEPALVMELVEGEGLDERIGRGAVPVEDTIPIARQIADALEAAHEKGIVHRDLKPANVRVRPDGTVKVLDFGLAKTMQSEAQAAMAPTRATSATRAGALLGTPGYMSPEQARGLAVDARTDVWAFGCLAYEMLTGRRAFARDTLADTLAAVLTTEVDLTALPRATPAPLVEIVRRSLAKHADDRPGTMREVTAALLLAAPEADGAGERASVLRRLRQISFSDELEESPVFSPDGTRIAFAREVGATRRIVLLELGSGREREITHGPHDDLRPAFTPDGRLLLFMRAQEPGRKLEPIDVFGNFEGADIVARELESGRERTLVENAANPAPAPDGARLAFDAAWSGPPRLWVADTRGQNRRQVTTDISEAVLHLRPRWSPDSRCLVFQSVERTRFDVRVVDVASQQLTWVTHDAIQDVAPVWCPTGRYIYFTSARGGGLNIWRAPVAASGMPLGPLQQITAGAGQDVDVAISSDGRRILFSILRQNADLWRLPLDPLTGMVAGKANRLLGSPREESRGTWSPDGRLVAFNSDRAGEMNLWLLDTGSGALSQLTDGPGGDFQARFSPDGKHLVYFSSRAGHADIWTFDLVAGRTVPLTDGCSADVNPTFLRDGRHVAFMSDRTGRLEVWLMGADGSGQRQLTDVGVMGHFLAIPPDDSGIVFRCPTSKPGVLKVPLSGGPPEPVGEIAGGAHMTFSPDGARILDVVAHKVLWVSPLAGGPPQKVFEFDDPDARIDYPNWSPDGKWALFDLFRPQGGNVWMMEET